MSLPSSYAKEMLLRNDKALETLGLCINDFHKWAVIQNLVSKKRLG